MEFEIEDVLYRFEEMAEAMEQSLHNLKKVIEEQTKLLELVTKHDKKNYFTDYLSAVDEQIANLKEQHGKVTFKKELLLQVIENCKNNKEHSKTISILAKALSIFD